MSNSESVIRFQTNGETQHAGNVSPQSAAPAAAVLSFYSVKFSKTEVPRAFTYATISITPTVRVTVTQCSFVMQIMLFNQSGRNTSLQLETINIYGNVPPLNSSPPFPPYP